MNNPFEHHRQSQRQGRRRRPPGGPGPERQAAREIPQREAHAPEDPPQPPVFRAPDTHWRGITWHDVPGHDEPTQRLNFTLLRRGMLGGHKSCRGLEGESLKAELLRLSARNRGNSRLSYKRAKGTKPAAGAAPAPDDFSPSSSAPPLSSAPKARERRPRTPKPPPL